MSADEKELTTYEWAVKCAALLFANQDLQSANAALRLRCEGAESAAEAARELLEPLDRKDFPLDWHFSPAYLEQVHAWLEARAAAALAPSVDGVKKAREA